MVISSPAAGIKKQVPKNIPDNFKTEKIKENKNDTSPTMQLLGKSTVK